MRSYLNATEQEILARARELVNQTLRQYHGDVADETVARLEIKSSDKGRLGSLIEVIHFGLALNNRPGPDFIDAGIELKTTGLKKLKNGQLVAKERLPLGMIDYMSFADENLCDFDNAGVLEKCKILLLMVYLFEPKVEIVDLLFKLIDLWEFPDVDLQIIRRDWEFIVAKIKQGKAHEISEGDTWYLGASTAGAGHGYGRAQPFNAFRKAKPRKFSLKKPYLDHVIAVLSRKRGKKFGRIINESKLITSVHALEDVVVRHFRTFYGMAVDDIMRHLGVKLNPTSKHFAAQLTKAVMSIELQNEIEEFEKAGIITKTVRLEPNGLPEQSVSFPAFKYKELVKESWEESVFKANLDSKFMFVFFQFDKPKNEKGEESAKRNLILKKVKFWNMPEADIKEAKKVWSKTVNLVKKGRIVKGFKNNGNRITFFPGSSDNRVSHVRPHGKDRNDVYDLPTPDIETGLTKYTKYCFWINNSYVRDSIYNP